MRWLAWRLWPKTATCKSFHDILSASEKFGRCVNSLFSVHSPIYNTNTWISQFNFRLSMKREPPVCRSELVADVMIHIRHGTTLLLRGMRWLICDQDAEYLVLGRQSLDRLGLNRTMLAAACDRFRGVVKLP